jgi:signal transduction histidine kinase
MKRRRCWNIPTSWRPNPRNLPAPLFSWVRSTKYCDAPDAQLRIVARRLANQILVDFVDNGAGIPKKSQGLIFEKFSRLSDQAAAGGAGLGLAICREIMTKLGGQIAYLPGQGGAVFRVTLPLVAARAVSGSNPANK